MLLASLHLCAGIKRGPARGGETGFPSTITYARQPSGRMLEAVGLPVLLTEQFARSFLICFWQNQAGELRCSETASATEGGFRHLKSCVQTARGVWTLKQTGVDLWEELRSFGGVFALAQSNLSSRGSKGCGHSGDHGKDAAVNGRRIWPSAICRRLSVKQPLEVINSPHVKRSS